jgi:hypothetical protein
MTSRKKTLLKGIGIENFKAFPEYTYIPIETLSMFIGPEGTPFFEPVINWYSKVFV